MEPKQVCQTGGAVATHPAKNISDLPIHRVGNVCFSRWELSAEERDALINNGSLLIGMVTGMSGPYPILPLCTNGYGEVDQQQLIDVVKQIGNGLSPEMFEPNGDESEAVLVHLTRKTWRLLMASIVSRLQDEKDPTDRLIIGTLGMIERQMNHTPRVKNPEEGKNV